MARVLLTGGGTGGHIYPALAVAEAMRALDPGVELLFVGAAGGMEERLVPRAGLAFAGVRAAGVVGKGAGRAARALLLMAAGTRQALGILRRFRPHVVVGTGGYASVPVGLAAILSRVPLVLQEQNAVPGLANRFLARRAALVALGYEVARRYLPPRAPVLVTGNPVRASVLAASREEARSALGLSAGEVLVLAFMGSRGSATVNRALVAAAAALEGTPRLRLLVATGQAHWAHVVGELGRAGVLGARRDDPPEARTARENSTFVPYLFDMDRALAAADLVVCRAGAITLAEVTARGLPAVLIPSPHVTHGHQEANAAVLGAAGAAEIIAERDLTGRRLTAAVLALAGDARRRGAMAAASKALGNPQAARDVARAVLALAGGDRASWNRP